MSLLFHPGVIFWGAFADQPLAPIDFSKGAGPMYLCVIIVLVLLLIAISTGRH